jgi:hypothetical protein
LDKFLVKQQGGGIEMKKFNGVLILVLALFLVVGISSMVAAYGFYPICCDSGDFARIDQYGKYNDATIIQTGENVRGNWCLPGSCAGDNMAMISQYGKDHSALITQTGAKNFASAFATGKGNDVVIRQEGLLQAAMVGQHGYKNDALVVQRGTLNFAGVCQSGARNDAIIRQLGDRDMAFVSQHGYKNDATIVQH